MKGITKTFPGVKALSNVSLRLFPGEVHALMGENGAGKSTLIKVLTGVYTKDEGTVTLDGKPVEVSTPLEAQNLGISTVYQEVNLCSNLSVVENIFIGREIIKRGRIDWKEMNRRAKELLTELNLDIDVSKTLGSYSVAIQQMVAIVRALNVKAKVLILDEPTSSLDLNEVQQLFATIRKLKKDGLCIVFISHFLDQIYEITDRLTVLRNGEWIGEYKTQSLPRYELISKMIGKEFIDSKSINENPVAENKGVSETVMEAAQLSKAGNIHPFNLELRKGEIMGLAGLLGSGRSELARLLFGADKADSGTIKVKGKKVHLNSPKQAIAHNIAFSSENRKSEGIIGDLSIRENMILALQGRQGWFNYMPRKQQEEIVDEYIKLLNINPPNPEQLIKNLSGGNQQKVLLARWLLTNPDLLILDEPTRGIDIGAKAEIQKLMVSLSEKGMSILFISSELEEILRTCKRISVLRDREKVSELENREHITQQDIMREIAGGVG
ncbi:sugar ABC transporter ATP-binding protein [Pseudalkalibacillus salsuginis]|uniref:sugar ABC transporter ATP-binding protein n=1 Tax=Pseudalkalibacillus salsuginis TaxID=2910972 RepID=UPI001F2F0D6A|nr:sugar ABC transporter ATP-binding protein [Pseudalkalibacillus salsuginis]